ncbi:MAG: hypothetical protein AVDCRST_MAG05-1351 [uncultured Rubrobacteraceae bacterium]|uniref:Uncharacterized protein n=1 Tax=uncultured Rubrobacteraceae bacterium TaxID=349277 RepID=A0A6J4S3Q8_9ACTN|nr:MAG: hypothetical protein AVDCRST_MAG05-1351 [uncultured Rubrobacteraceae bacterium]
MPALFQLGEADDLAALVRDQRVPARHALVPGGRVRDLGRPRPHLLRRVVPEVHRPDGLVEQAADGFRVAGFVIPNNRHPFYLPDRRTGPRPAATDFLPL